MSLKIRANSMVTTTIYPANTNQAELQSGTAALKTKRSITEPAPIMPKVAPTPFDIIMNSPCAPALIPLSTFCSTYNEPAIL